MDNNVASLLYIYLMQHRAQLFQSFPGNDPEPSSLQYFNGGDLQFNHATAPMSFPKPTQSYIGMIAMAILDSPEEKLLLSDIYRWIITHYPYFNNKGPGWRNSIRHNLSLNECFIKSGRGANGKGHYWAINPSNIDDFRRGNFRRRNEKRQQRAKRDQPECTDDPHTSRPSEPNRKPMKRELPVDQSVDEEHERRRQVGHLRKRRKFDIDSILRTS